MDAFLKNSDFTRKKLEAILGPPYFYQPGFILYNIDCLSAMQSMIAANFEVPLIVTSPPYNIGKEYESNMQLDDYLSWCKVWMNAIYQISSTNAGFWLNLGYTSVYNRGRAVPLTFHLWDSTPFFLLQQIIWYHEAGGGNYTKMFSSRHENFLWFVKDQRDYICNIDSVRIPAKYPDQKKNGKLRCHPLGRNPFDVWCIPKVTSGKGRASSERVNHPAQMPLEVARRIIRVSSNPGAIIFDPFAGSSTSGIASLQVGEGRIFIGCEKRRDYCELGKQRAIAIAKST